MMEDKWLAADHSQPMLDFLMGKVSDRKLRLFACACARHFWDHFKDARSRRAVEIAERYADGLVKRSEVTAARKAAFNAAYGPKNRKEGSSGSARRACYECCTGNAWQAASCAASSAAWAQFRRFQQVRLLHCIFGNPFRIPVIEPSWLTWNDGTTDKIAQRIYDEREYSLMPILADALEEAGCDNDDILRHCREPGEHVRGCWVIDLLLGKG